MPCTRPFPPAGCKPAPLKDACNDRPCASVPLPAAQLLTAEHFWDETGKPDVKTLIGHLVREGAVAQDLVLDICQKAAAVLEQEPNLLKLDDPITVVGDIHGQFYDLVKLLELGGPPGETQYLFLGDYVDRGSFSVEVILTMFAIKLCHPKRVYMLRGNHECRLLTAHFNFREETEYKYDASVYDALMTSFDALPLAATINGQFLAVHGGLSPDIETVKAIHDIDRFREIPRKGALCDLVWSDPLEEKEGGTCPKAPDDGTTEFVENTMRQCSYFFTFKGADKFLEENGMLSILRAHEVQLEGFKMHQTNTDTGFPSVITVFSAPNYCDAYNNKGAILTITNNTLNVLQLEHSPHPYLLPNFGDVFTWSMPFVLESVVDILSALIKRGAGDADYEDVLSELHLVGKQFSSSLSESNNLAVEVAARLAASIEKDTQGNDAGEDSPGSRLRKKVQAVGSFGVLLKGLRQGKDSILRLKSACPGHKLPPGSVIACQGQANTDVFSHIGAADAINEMLPA